LVGAQDYGTTLSQYIDHFRNKIIPNKSIKGKPLSPAYVYETNRILDKILVGFESENPIKDISQSDIANYLTCIESADAANQHRIRLIQLWRHAISDEHITDNLPERIIRRDADVRKRERLTIDQYKSIFEHASPAIKNAMELS